MSNTGIFWIREDFRIENNPALSFATQNHDNVIALYIYCLLYTSPSPRDATLSRMPSSA